MIAAEKKIVETNVTEIVVSGLRERFGEPNRVGKAIIGATIAYTLEYLEEEGWLR